MHVLVLGVGNILFGDEGLGVRTAEYLQQHACLPDCVDVVDGGTLGMRLMDAIMACDLLVVLDAVVGGGVPGSLYRLEGSDLRRGLSSRCSLHQTDLVDTLLCCELLGHRPETVILGMEPESWKTMCTWLSPRVTAAVPGLAGAVLDLLEQRGILPH